MSDDLSSIGEAGIEDAKIADSIAKKEQNLKLFLGSLYTALGSLEIATYSAHLYGANVSLTSQLQDLVSNLRSVMSQITLNDVDEDKE